MLYEKIITYDSQIIFIDNAFNIYTCTCITITIFHNGTTYEKSYFFQINNDEYKYEFMNPVKGTPIINYHNYNVKPLSNILIDQIKYIYRRLQKGNSYNGSIDKIVYFFNEYKTSAEQLFYAQTAFIKINTKSHENMLLMKNIQRMLSEKEDQFAKITAELQEANKKLIIMSTKKGHKIKKCRNVSIKKYLCNIKIKHKKD